MLNAALDDHPIRNRVINSALRKGLASMGYAKKIRVAESKKAA